MDVPQLRREQLATLIPISPLLMSWIRCVTHNTADLFQQSYADDYDNVALGLGELVQTMQNNPDVPYSTLFSICDKYKPSVWANALRLIFTQSQPKIIPPEIGSDIVGTIPALKGATAVNEVCNILGPLLDKLPRKHFAALGEFCALIRDTATHVTFLATLVGPQLLMPNLLINSEKMQGPGALAAAAVMELLILEAESLFGRCAATRVFMPFGEFGLPDSAKYTDKRIDAVVDFKTAINDNENTIAKNALRAFYDWRDPIRSDSIDTLFSSLKLGRIAHGLQQKYGLIPPGWGFILAAQAETESRKSQSRVLSRKDSTMPNLQESEPLLLVVQEVCRNEKEYNSILNTFLTSYCDMVLSISEGKEGEAERNCLGLTAVDIETLFGRKLRAVKEVSDKLAARLDLITDFQDIIDRDGRGKLGMVIDAFRLVYAKFDNLAPYLASYKTMMNLLAERKAEALKKAKKKKKKKGMNFLELWELQRVKHDNIKYSQIDSILYKPVTKLPGYKVLLKELHKMAGKENHPATGELEQLMKEMETLGQKVDRQVDNSKANKILGIKD